MVLDRLKELAVHDALDRHRAALERARRELRDDRAAGLAALERTVDGVWTTYVERLRERAEERLAVRVVERLDAALRTDEPELMDRPDFPDEERARMVGLLDRFNRAIGTYRRALSFTTPMLEEAGRRTRRSPRLLDLASGHGGFPTELARHASRRGLPVEITGSDIQPTHVATGAAVARRRNVRVAFRVVNGFHMERVEDGEFDVVTMLQAMHHFSPGQLARMIAESARVATTAFVGIDGVRAFWLAATVPIHTLLFTGDRAMVHDAWLSTRKMYDRSELALIARAADADAVVRCRTRFPGFNVLEVIRPRRER